jgi:hypothetical protein
MASWSGIVLALRRPEDDGLRSRLPTFLHPLAGRILAWHGLSAMAARRPAPRRLLLASPEPLDPVLVGDTAAEPLHVAADAWVWEVAAALGAGVEAVLVADAAAPLLDTGLDQLLAGPTGTVLVGAADEVLAVWIPADALRGAEAAAPQTLADFAVRCRRRLLAPESEALLVRDRAGLARASTAIRDRIVARLMEAGVTFLQPATVQIDAEVVVGPDTVIYPGVVLEGKTRIGAETVIGPGCRIIDSTVGTGVELKGWNYLVATSLRNRAVLEPYVRRGFD